MARPEKMPAEPPHLASVPGRVLPFRGECQWLVALDYDGTLRAESGVPVSPGFFELMQLWRAQGVRWGINTGRSMPCLLEELLPLLPALPDFICTCERYVHMGDACGVLRAARLHNERCLRDNLSLRARGVPVVHEGLTRLRGARPELRWEFAADDPLSVEAADDATLEEMLPTLRQLEAALPGASMQCAGRCMRFADARHSKGHALAYVARSWKVPGERLFIMGDGRNDLDAFRLFPEAFCAAPASAHAEVCACLGASGGYVSPCNGVEEALHHWYARRVCGVV